MSNPAKRNMSCYTSKVSLLIPAAALSAFLALAGCEDDPILGPTDQDPGGGSYGVIHFEEGRADSGREVRLDDFLKDNPRRF